MNADASARGQFNVNFVVEKIHRIISRLRPFLLVAETRSIARFRLGDVSGLETYIAGDRLEQHIAEIGMSASREVCVREAENRGVVVPITGGPVVTLLERTNLSVWRQLHHSERHGCSGKRVAVSPGPNEGIDQGGFGLCRKRYLCGCHVLKAE